MNIKGVDATWQEKGRLATLSSERADIQAANERLHAYGQQRALEARTLLTEEQIDRFACLLEGPEGCNFHHDAQGILRWNCEGKRDLSRARRILTSMEIPPATAEAFLGCCVANGGHCSCEILLNAIDRIAPELKTEEEAPDG